MQLKGFIGPAYTLQSTNLDCQRCVNLYPQMDESGVGKNVAALLGTPGLDEFAVLYENDADTFHPARGMISTSTGRLFVVVNTSLLEVTVNPVSGVVSTTDHGTLSSSAGFVGMADNGLQMMLVDGLHGYSFDLSTNLLTAIADFPGNTTQDGGIGSVTFLDGFFVFNKPGSQVFYITNPYSTVVDQTNFASAEGSPDNLLTLLSDHELLWLFGANSTEVWYDSGDQLFPFARMQGGVIPFGVAAARTPARFAGSVAWLSRDENGQGVVLMSNGLQPQRISTHAIEQALASYPKISDATAYTYQQDGHSFYVLNCPSGNTTWVYDAVTQLWHERAFTGERGLERQRSEMHVEAFGKHIVSDYQKGWLYVLNRFALNDVQYDNGKKDWVKVPITKRRTSPYIADELKNLFISRLQLDMQTGVGADGLNPTLHPADAIPPQCMLRWSDDGGHTWSNEHWTSLGAVGANKTRVIWRRLGRTRQRVFEVTITDNVFVAMNDAFISTSEGVS